MARCAVRAAYQRRTGCPKMSFRPLVCGGDIRSAMSLLVGVITLEFDASALGSTVDKLAILMTIE